MSATQFSLEKSDSGDNEKRGILKEDKERKEEEGCGGEQTPCYSSSFSSTSWDVYKENIQPIPQGRKFNTLIQALPLIDDNKARQQLFEDKREQFDKDLEANGEDESKQLDLWYEYIDWLEQNTPDGGKVNGVTNAIERCIELYYNRKKFKQDERLFEIFMKFKRFCDEPIEVFGFMYANSICTLLSSLYLNWSWQYESRKNMKKAEDMIKLGIKNLATPREVLLEAQEQLKFRILHLIRDGALDDQIVISNGIETTSMRETQNELTNSGIRAALQTLKYTKTKKNGSRVPINRTGPSVVEDRANVGGLKSQTKIVNGVRVPANTMRATTTGRQQSLSSTSAPSTSTGFPKRPTSTLKQSHKPILVFNEEQENGYGVDEGGHIGRNVGDAGERSNEGSVVGSNENGENGFSNIMFKMPTSQPIQSIGRSGAENQVPRTGRLTE